MTQLADFTYLSTLLRCGLQHHWRYKEMLEPVGGKSVPLLAGSLGHSVLESFYKGGDLQEALAELYPLSGIVAVGTFDYMTQGHWSVMMHKYAATYASDQNLRATSFIEAPLVSERLQLGGIPDMIVEDAEGALEVWDHKFTTGWLGNLEARLEMSAQLPIYCILASEHTGQPVRKAVLNMVHMGPGASNPKSKAEKFARRTYTFSAWQLEETERWIRETQTLGVHYGMTPTLPPRNADSHCSWCEFRELCGARSETVREAVKATAFKKRNITGTLLSGADMEEV